MKISHLILGILPITSVIGLSTGFNAPALAQCIQSHNGIQLNIGQPAEQTHNVSQTGDGPCTGNVQSSTTVQVNRNNRTGGRQHQEVKQHVEGNANPTGINGPTVKSSIVIDANIETPEGFNSPSRSRR